MARLSFRILGCGSSGGVPRLGGHWGECDPNDPRNTRRRCSMLVTREDDAGVTRVLIDASPDLRGQLLDAGVGELDAVVFTHAHADHTHGLDDLRMVVFNMRRRLTVWADADTADSLLSRFGYAFVQPKGSDYPPILNMNLIDGPITINGEGGAIVLQPFRVNHGNINSLGFRMNGLAYLPDALEMTAEAWRAVRDLDCWIVDALRRTPHPSHTHLSKTLSWIERAQPQRAVLTNMHIDLDYATVDAETPPNVLPAFDGMTLQYDV